MPDDLAWMDSALCAETAPDLFLPDGKGTNNSIEAKKICARCDVIAECLAWALATDAEGTLGGMSEGQRKKLLARKAKGPRFSHGTRYGYSRGCRTEEACPRNAEGVSCRDARRAYMVAWRARNREETRKRANGRAA